MATLTIRNLPDDVYHRLRIRAAENHRSMEAEVRSILGEALPSGANEEPAAQSVFAERSKTWRAETPRQPRAKLSAEELLKRIEETMATVPKDKLDDFTVDKFLAERRAMWGEE